MTGTPKYRANNGVVLDPPCRTTTHGRQREGALTSGYRFHQEPVRATSRLVIG